MGEQIKKEPFTPEEKEIWDLLAIATNKFMKLSDKHPMADMEWCLATHQLQGLLQHRVTKRDYPDSFF